MHHLYNVCVGTADRWPYLILLQAVPALLSLVVLPFLPETPRYLLLVLRDRESAVKGRAYCVQGVRSFPSSMAFPVLGGGGSYRLAAGPEAIGLTCFTPTDCERFYHVPGYIF